MLHRLLLAVLAAALIAAPGMAAPVAQVGDCGGTALGDVTARTAAFTTDIPFSGLTATTPATATLRASDGSIRQVTVKRDAASGGVTTLGLAGTLPEPGDYDVCLAIAGGTSDAALFRFKVHWPLTPLTDQDVTLPPIATRTIWPWGNGPIAQTVTVRNTHLTSLAVYVPSVAYVAQRTDATTTYGPANVTATVTPASPHGESVTLKRNASSNFTVAVDGPYVPGDHVARLSFRGVDGGIVERDLPYRLRYHWLVFTFWLLLGTLIGLGIDALRDVVGKRIPVFADASDTLATLQSARAKIAAAYPPLAELFDPCVAAAASVKEDIRAVRRFDVAMAQQMVAALQSRYAALDRRVQLAPRIAALDPLDRTAASNELAMLDSALTELRTAVPATLFDTVEARLDAAEVITRLRRDHGERVRAAEAVVRLLEQQDHSQAEAATELRRLADALEQPAGGLTDRVAAQTLASDAQAAIRLVRGAGSQILETYTDDDPRKQTLSVALAALSPSRFAEAVTPTDAPAAELRIDLPISTFLPRDATAADAHRLGGRLDAIVGLLVLLVLLAVAVQAVWVTSLTWGSVGDIIAVMLLGAGLSAGVGTMIGGFRTLVTGR